jgi:hypothetical protein
VAYGHDIVHHKIQMKLHCRFQVRCSSSLKITSFGFLMKMVKPWVFMEHASIFQVAKVWGRPRECDGVCEELRRGCS